MVHSLFCAVYRAHFSSDDSEDVEAEAMFLPMLDAGFVLDPIFHGGKESLVDLRTFDGAGGLLKYPIGMSLIGDLMTGYTCRD